VWHRYAIVKLGRYSMAAEGLEEMADLVDAAETPIAATIERLLYPVSSVAAAAPRDTLREACASEDLCSALHVRAGDYIEISRSVPLASPADNPWTLRLVEAEVGAVVCRASSRKRCGALPALFLPANMIENLKGSPGRSIVMVGKAELTKVPLAKRVVVSRVHSPDMHRRHRAALCSFFRIPRLLRAGEIFSVPFAGVPHVLRDIEEGVATYSQDSVEDSSDNEHDTDEWVEGCRPGVQLSGCVDYHCDPLAGLAFCGMFSFRVETVEPVSSHSASHRSRCCRVDSEQTELLVQGTCNARGLPYMANHFFCIRPKVQPLSLQGPFERMLGLLAPAVRNWAKPAAGAAVASHAILVAGARGCGKRMLWRSVCERLGLHLMEVSCYHGFAHGPGGAEEALQQLVSRVAESSPAVLCLRRLQALSLGGPSLSPAAGLLQQRRLELALSGALRAEHDGGAARPGLVILAGTCENFDDVSSSVRNVFQVELQLPRPNEQARCNAISRLLPNREGCEGARSVEQRSGSRKMGVPADAMAKLTTGLSYKDLYSVCSAVAMSQDRHIDPDTAERHEEEVIEQAVKRLQGGSKVAVTLSSKVQWADIGGLQDAKDEVMNCITLPLTQGHLFGGQKLRSGILLFGPPGTGKTLLAKAVATECRVHFLSVKGPELLSMYIGESEKNVRSIFQSSRDLQPCVLFFDELDSLAPARGRGSDSGGVMDRVVSQLLTELDALPTTVFLIGATNRPDLLDRSLLRPGRLDRMVYLGVAAEKLPMLCAITRKFELDEPPHDGGPSRSPLLQSVAMACPSNLTGADVAVLCADAYGLAQREHIKLLDEVAAKAEVSVSTLLLFLEALDRAQKDSTVSEAPTTWGDCALVPLFPLGRDGRSVAHSGIGGGCALEDVPAGLALYRWRAGGGAAAPGAAAPHGGPGPLLLTRHGGGAGDTDAVVSVGPFPPEEQPNAAAGAGVGAEPLLHRCARCRSWLAATVGAGLSRCTAVRSFCPLRGLHVQVGWRHFQEALRQLQPSVPCEDLQRYEQLAKEYQNTKK